jgi:aerobic-type carbon monoxide dehydrogenase small subunit (CoxS/CutS family)
MATIRFTVNGTARSVDTEPERPLLEVLREDLGLTGTKYGCGEAQCGACTVLLDNQAIFSCITPVSAAQGRKITTIEGLATGGKLHPVQQAPCSAATARLAWFFAPLLYWGPIPSPRRRRSSTA